MGDVVDKKEADDLKKAKDAVFRLLKIRLRSEKEIEDKLTRKNFPAKVIEETIRYFKNLTLIDDRPFAQNWIASRLKKPFGVRRIRLELKTKGIDPAILDKELQKATQEYSEFDSAKQLAQKQVSKYHGVPKEKIQRRIYEYLLRRGFSTATVMNIIKEL